MRRTKLHVRLMLSLACTIILAGFSMIAQGGMPALAQPGQQQAQPVDLVVDNSAKSGDPGAIVTYNFTVTRAALPPGGPDPCTSGTFNINVTGATFTFAPPGSIAVAPGGRATFSIDFRVPSNATPGAADDAVVQVVCTTNTAVADAVLIVTTVTIGGATPTRTPLATITTTPTGTAGPTPTPGPICADVYEPDNALAQARELRPDQPQTRAICPRGDEDWLVFGGVAGKVYTIDVTEMANGLDLTLSLYDAVGNLLAFNNDFPRTEPFDIRPRIQSWRAPVNGNYYVKVRDDAGRGDRGLTYTVELQSEAYGPTPTLIAELCQDLFEPDGVPEQARLMVIREIQPNKRFCPAGDADWVRFFAKAGENYVVRTDSRNRAGADPVLILVDRDGATLLDFNDDSGGTLDARIDFTPQVDGFYYAQTKNVGDIGSQFIIYDLIFELSDAPTQPQPPVSTPGTGITVTPGSPTVTGTPGTTTPTAPGTPGTGVTQTPTIAPILDAEGNPYPAPSQTALVAETLTARPAGNSIDSVKGAPAFVNGTATDFVDPALRNVWARTDQVVAARKVDRSWMWGPGGLVARVEVYTQANGGARQVQYFDKARMEITDWSRDRTNPWFVTNGLLVKEMVEGRLQLGDAEFVAREPAAIGIAGDIDDSQGPTYASFARHLGAVERRVGQTATTTLRRDGSTGSTATRPEAKLVHFVPETGHNIPQVFWEFLNARGPVGDGSRDDVLVDWVFAMGYPISEPYWTKVKVGGVERDVLVQAFQRRVLTYTPSNPKGWQVEMGNVGRHYYAWRYGRQP